MSGLFTMGFILSDSDILAFIAYQNEGIPALTWKVVNKSLRGTEDAVVTLLVDEASAHRFRTDNAIAYRYGHTFLYQKKSVAEALSGPDNPFGGIDTSLPPPPIVAPLASVPVENANVTPLPPIMEEPVVDPNAPTAAKGGARGKGSIIQKKSPSAKSPRVTRNKKKTSQQTLFEVAARNKSTKNSRTKSSNGADSASSADSAPHRDSSNEE